MTTSKYVHIIPAPASGLPAFDAVVTEQPPHIWGGGNEPFPTPPIAFPPGWIGGVPPGIWGPNDPRPTPPIAFPPGWVGGVPPPMSPPKADWVHRDEGWYFVFGPFDKPRPIGSANSVDPIDCKWTYMADGWYFVAGPFPKPRPIGPIQPPDTEPPTEPPETSDCKWRYTAAGWVLVCGPYDKPKPPHA